MTLRLHPAPGGRRTEDMAEPRLLSARDRARDCGFVPRDADTAKPRRPRHVALRRHPLLEDVAMRTWRNLGASAPATHPRCPRERSPSGWLALPRTCAGSASRAEAGSVSLTRQAAGHRCPPMDTILCPPADLCVRWRTRSGAPRAAPPDPRPRSDLALVSPLSVSGQANLSRACERLGTHREVFALPLVVATSSSRGASGIIPAVADRSPSNTHSLPMGEPARRVGSGKNRSDFPELTCRTSAQVSDAGREKVGPPLSTACDHEPVTSVRELDSPLSCLGPDEGGQNPVDPPARRLAHRPPATEQSPFGEDAAFSAGSAGQAPIRHRACARATTSPAELLSSASTSRSRRSVDVMGGTRHSATSGPRPFFR